MSNLGHLHCTVVLTEGPRAGQVCGRRYMRPHEACVRCRPKPPAGRPAVEPTEARRARDRERIRRRRGAGVPTGWVV